MTNTIVRARVDEHVKEEAATVLAAMGLTVSDTFRLMMVRIANDKALRFEPFRRASMLRVRLGSARTPAFTNARGVRSLERFFLEKV